MYRSDVVTIIETGLKKAIKFWFLEKKEKED